VTRRQLERGLGIAIKTLSGFREQSGSNSQFVDAAAYKILSGLGIAYEGHYPLDELLSRFVDNA
jgi:hypothetical protein